MKAGIQILIVGLIVFTTHILLNLFVLGGYWDLSRFFWLDFVLIGLSFGIIFVTEKTSEKDFNKVAITYSLLGMAKLISLAFLLLILSKFILPLEKTPLIVHFIIPTFLLLITEALLVKKILNKQP